VEPVPDSFARVLAVGAHPDDVDFFAGATLAALAAGGARLHLVVCTDGRRGGRDPDEMAARRREEQRAAARALGAEALTHLEHEDGKLEVSEALRLALVEAIRGLRPELVLGHDPRTFFRPATRAELGHSDHRAAGTALLDAVYPRAVSPAFYPELALDPWYPRQLWLFDTAEPDLVVDAAAGWPAKEAALRAHASQQAVAGGLVKAAREMGQRLAGAADAFGEGFVRLRLW